MSSEQGVLQTFRRLFEARTDAYLQESPDGRAVCVREPLTEALWIDHLHGRLRLGSYPLVRDAAGVITANGITLDLDGKNSARFPGGPSQALVVAGTIVALAEDVGLPVYLYPSRSKQGYHARLFGQLPWQEAQRVGEFLARGAADAHGLEPSAIEVFPKGRPETEFGGTPFAEYHGLLRDGDGSNLLIDTRGEPLPDQLGALLDIEVVSAANLRAALRLLEEKVPPTTVISDPAALGEAGPADTPQPGDWVAAAMRGVPVGSRNEFCTKLAGRFLARGETLPTTIEILRCWNLRNEQPLPEDELTETVRGLFRRHGKPREISPFEHPLDLCSLSEADEEIPWLIDRLVARGDLTLITGLPDAGKSLLSCHAAYCLALGKPVLGRFAVPQPMKVVVLSADNPSRVDRLRLRRLAAGLGCSPEDAAGNLFWFSHRDLTLEGTVFLELREFINLHRPDVLIIDTLGAVFPGDVCEGDAVRSFIRTVIRPLIDEFDIAVIVVHHRRKEGGRGTPNDPGNSILGSVSLWASIDNHWSLKARGDDHFSFIHHKCRWPEKEPPFVFRARDIVSGDGVTLEYVEGLDEQKARASTHRAEAVEALAELLGKASGHRLAPKEARKQLEDKFTGPTVDRAATALEDAGRLRRLPAPPRKCKWWVLIAGGEDPEGEPPVVLPFPGAEPPTIGSDHSDL